MRRLGVGVGRLDLFLLRERRDRHQQTDSNEQAFHGGTPHMRSVVSSAFPYPLTRPSGGTPLADGWPSVTITRTPLFFGPEQRSLFGWYHAPKDAGRELAVVICPPFGHEYINSHRSLRHLADRLAEQGMAALRFDYDGTGDSAGGDTEAARVAAWRESIVIAMRELSA